MNNEEKVKNEHEIRVEKVQEMEQAGMQPWPSFKKVTASCQEAKDSFVEGQESDKTFCLSGRLMSQREHGKTIFGNTRETWKQKWSIYRFIFIGSKYSRS